MILEVKRMAKPDNPDKVKKKGSKRKIVYSLDWNAQAYEDRKACVDELDRLGRLNGLAPSQLNEVANYLLYSEDVDCDVELKQPSKKPISYEDLVENGVADMAFYNAKYKNIYRVAKPSIDKEKDKDIPGMKELWEEMDKVKAVYDYLDDCLKGRRERDFTNPLEINYVNHHFYKKWYIDLALNQYTLKDMYKPVMATSIQDYIDIRPDDNYEFGIRAGKYVINDSDEKTMIDLGNPVHIYALIKNYKSIRLQHTDNTTDDWNILYDLIDNAIGRVAWSDCLWDILEKKVNGENNDVVGPYVREKYGVNYNNNYISTLFTKSISKKIAKAAILNAKRITGNTSKRICPRCKQERWDDEFYSYAKSCGYCLRKFKNMGRKIHLKQEG